MLSAFVDSRQELLAETGNRRRYLRNDLSDHLHPAGPKRILSLDGGGVRTAMSIAILHKIDTILRERHGNSPRFHLSDYFDLVGGTSTGAILASLIVTGKFSVREMREVFFELAHRVYGPKFFRPSSPGSGRCFDSRRLNRTLAEIFGDATLDDDRIATGLAVFGKRIDTDETIIFHNNPNSPSFSPNTKGGSGFGRYLISGVLRASTCAPEQFSPSMVNLLEKPGKYAGLFVDGSITSHNNPAFQLYLLCTLKDKGFEWKTGPQNLQITSIGTGALCRTFAPNEARQLRPRKLAREALSSMLDGVDHSGDLMMQMISEGKALAHVHDDAEGTKMSAIGEPKFTYQRYQARLRQDILRQELGLALSTKQLETVRTMSNPDGMQIAYEIGQAVADHMLSAEDFSPQFDLPGIEVKAVPVEPIKKAHKQQAPAHAFSALELMPDPVFPHTPAIRSRINT